MTTDQSQKEAVALKDKGNDAFKKHDWPSAIEFYTQAIDKDDTQAAFYSNRAAANLKVEAYGYAIADATHAIDRDPKNVKVWT